MSDPATTPAAPTDPAKPAAAEAPAATEAPPTAEAPAAEQPAAAGDSKSTDIVAGQGGVMTDEVGVVTGDLTLRSELSAGTVVVKVQYKDADEWYAVTGAKATLKDPADLEAVHAIAVGILNRPEG
ncbi:hypothetical protein [Winogradskya humida]|uniref:Uncharacterized protein n=1 Tax=Winogradskya humida TaxID=113566 RepID=A0ABQ4A4V4_9ACTN|nr:hypothetical protein [Actinoplanes humidus]GIE25875.1 hypothetical protein Ahu01nite_089770 [Actinoplanes humidus]